MIEFQDTSLLSWNIRGAYSQGARRHMRELLRRLKPTIVIITETHIQFAQTKQFWDREGYTPLDIMEAQGHAGRLWMLKQSGSNINFSIIAKHLQAITVKLNVGAKNWYCSGIYASPTLATRS